MSHLVTGDDVAAGAESLKAGWGTPQILSLIPNKRVIVVLTTWTCGK